MCLTPNILDCGTAVACRECWQCRQRKIDDWIGRNIAESRMSDAALGVTFTYGRDAQGNQDHLRATILTYSDIQKLIKLLRYHGYSVRYFFVGEYGATKGRAHWHGMLYFSGSKIPEVPIAERFDWLPYWPHGYSYFDEAGPQAVRYMCKYIQKATNDADMQSVVRPSKKPPLGTAYFQDLAARSVAQGITPNDYLYSFPEVPGKEFHMCDSVRKIFMDAFMLGWHAKYDAMPPMTDPVREYNERWFIDGQTIKAQY